MKKKIQLLNEIKNNCPKISKIMETSLEHYLEEQLK